MAEAHEPAAPAERPGEPLTPSEAIQADAPAAAPASTAVQAAPPAEEKKDEAPVTREEDIPLPPPEPERRTINPERLLAEITRLDRVLVGLLLALAFLLASFAIQNSDFWQHLATGRLLAQGDYTFGANPFSHPETLYWANHAWLFDLTTYGLASLGGGVDTAAGQALLIIFKALLTVALAWVLLSIRRPGQSLWLPVVCTAVALLALSTRLFYQPVIVSYLFLALTLYLLTRPVADESGAAPRRGLVALVRARPVWLLPPLFVLWANLDYWYFLGPVTVLLFLLGEIVQRFVSSRKPGAEVRRGAVGTLALVFVIGLLACLVTPFHYHGLTLPLEPSYLLAGAADWISEHLGVTIPLPDSLAAAGRAYQRLLREDPTAIGRPLSPLSGIYFQSVGVRSVAGLAYYVLLLASLASFGLNTAGWKWGRFVVWLGFALFGMFQVRAVPFFAVVAGPITALNFQELIARRFGTAVRVEGGWRAWALGGRVLTIVAGLVLLVTAWPGWLHGQSDDPRRTRHVAWEVVPDPVLELTARQLGRLHEPGNAFVYHPEQANYVAWFAPREKTFFDFRLGLFDDERVGDFVRLRKLLGNPLPSSREVTRLIFRTNDLRHAVLGRDRVRTLLWANPQEWPQPAVGGLSLVFGWNDPRRPGRPVFAGRRLDLDALAFAPGTPDRSPDRGPGGDPVAATVWSRFRDYPAGPAAGTVQADWYDDFGKVAGQRASVVQLSTYVIANQVAPWPAAVATCGIGAGSVLGPATLAGMLDYPDRVFGITNYLFGKSWPSKPDPTRKDRPPQPLTGRWIAGHFEARAAPVLSVRAARRGVAASPRDPEAYLALGRAYYRLWKEQEEVWSALGLARERGLLLLDQQRANVLQQQASPKSFLELQRSFRQSLREVQTVTALQHALDLKPDLADAHRLLYQIYRQVNYLDAALEHLDAFVEAMRSARTVTRQRGESRAEFEQRKEFVQGQFKALDAELKALKAEVLERKKDFRLATATGGPRLSARVGLALLEEYRTPTTRDPRGRGLAKEALTLLLKARAREMDLLNATRQLQLLITTGQTAEVRQRLPDLKSGVKKRQEQLKSKPELARDQRYQNMQAEMEFGVRWLEALLDAADGAYDRADAVLAPLQDQFRVGAQERNDRLLRLLQYLIGPDLLRNQFFTRQGIIPILDGRTLDALAIGPSLGWYVDGAGRYTGGLVAPLRRQAEFALLRGLLALEHGEVGAAEKLFRLAVRKSRNLPGYPDHIIAEEYLRLIEKQQKAAR